MPSLPLHAVDFSAHPTDVGVENIFFASPDGLRSKGLLYRRGGERTVVCFTHPRANFSQHWLIPHLLDAGYAACGLTHRQYVDYWDNVHEEMVADLAGGIRHLKSNKGFDNVVLLANSGGGGIFGLYQWQAEEQPPNRLTHTPAGDEFDLNNFDIPVADGLIVLAAPFGQPHAVSAALDPSVIDESDPYSCDPELDMYNTRNGYRKPPESSKYSAGFLEDYRAAQQARVRRIDATAHQLIAEQRRHQKLTQDSDFAALPLDDQHTIQRRALATALMLVYRTQADPAFCDLSLHPSDRAVGTHAGFDPQVVNYSRNQLGQMHSPRSWLSTSSILSSRSDLRLALPNIHVPTIFINYTADRLVYPDQKEEMLALSAASDKSLHHLSGDHYGFPASGSSEGVPREKVVRLLSEWLSARFRAR